jgi:hypothetical protein
MAIEPEWRHGRIKGQREPVVVGMRRHHSCDIFRKRGEIGLTCMVAVKEVHACRGTALVCGRSTRRDPRRPGGSYEAFAETCNV